MAADCGALATSSPAISTTLGTHVPAEATSATLDSGVVTALPGGGSGKLLHCALCCMRNNAVLDYLTARTRMYHKIWEQHILLHITMCNATYCNIVKVTLWNGEQYIAAN